MVNNPLCFVFVESDADRLHHTYGAAETFEAARVTCVATNGDLATDRDNFTHVEAVYDFSGMSLE